MSEAVHEGFPERKACDEVEEWVGIGSYPVDIFFQEYVP